MSELAGGRVRAVVLQYRGVRVAVCNSLDGPSYSSTREYSSIAILDEYSSTPDSLIQRLTGIVPVGLPKLPVWPFSQDDQQAVSSRVYKY